MTTQGDAAQTYRDELILALRLRDVPALRIGDALAEVDSHTADTGEDPRDAFGPPAAYADALVAAFDGRPGTGGWTSWLTWRHAGLGLVAGASTYLATAGVYALSGLDAWRGGLTAPGALVVGLAGVAVVSWWVIRGARRERILDPRNGTDLTPRLPIWVLGLIIGLPLAILAAGLTVGLVAR